MLRCFIRSSAKCLLPAITICVCMNAVIGCSTTVVETQLSSAATKASRAERSNPVAELERQQQFWQQRLERDPSDFISRHKSAQLLMQLARVTGDHNRYVQAEAVLRPGVEFAPVYELLVDLAFALNAQHKFAEAMQVAQTAVGLDSGISLDEGVYAGVLGPCFETPAEVRMLRQLGCDAVGMSTVPEVIAARARGIKVLGISSITNSGSGLSSNPLSHSEVLDAGRELSGDMGFLVRGVVERLGIDG